MVTATISSDILGKAHGSRQVRRVGRPGQGIIEANRKTEICRHWLSGACPFGVKCAFAHGAQELRSLALDADRTSFDAAGTTAAPFPQVAPGGAAASCCDQRCTACRDRTVCSSDKSRLLPSDMIEYYRAPRSNDSGLDEFLLDKSAPSYAMDDLHLSMNCLRLDSQQTSSNKHAAHTGDKSRGNFSLWESPNTILQGTALGCAEANGRKYKADEEVPRRVFGSVNTRAIVSGKVPRHAFDEANTKSISSKHVVHATAATEAEVRGSIRGRETWAKIARGGSYDGAGNDPSRMQGNQYRELVEAGYCSGESSRPRSDVVYESRHDIVPRTCDFSYFQTRRASHRSASIPPRRSPAGRPASSASVAPVTAGNTVDWDPVRYDAPHLGDASTSFCDDKKQAAMGAGRANLTMQQRLDEDGTAPGMVSTLLEIAKTRRIPERSTTPWCEFPVASAEDSSSKKRLDTVEVPRLSRVLRSNDPRYLSESTRTMPHAGRESTTTTLNTGRPNTGREPTMASVNNEWQPIFRGQKPLTPSPKYDEVFPVIRDVTGIPPRPTLAWGPGASKTGTITKGTSSMW